MNLINRGEIYYADFGKTVGSEQKGIRPVVIVQNNMGNIYSATTIVAAITSRLKSNMPTHVHIENESLPKKSVILAEQLRTIDKSRLLERIGLLDEQEMIELNNALSVSVGVMESERKTDE